MPPRAIKITTESTEKLIILVRDRPFLYDASLAEYKDAILNSNAWNSVAATMKVANMTGKITKGNEA